MKAPGSVVAQMGKKTNKYGMGKARAGGKNQGKVAGTSRRYHAHPRKQGQ